MNELKKHQRTIVSTGLKKIAWWKRWWGEYCDDCGDKLEYNEGWDKLEPCERCKEKNG